MRQLVLMLPVLLLTGCGDGEGNGITWPVDDSQYAVVVGGKITLNGEPYPPSGWFVPEVLLYPREGCTGAWCRAAASARQFDGSYVVTVPLEGWYEARADWCGATAKARVPHYPQPSDTHTDSMMVVLSEATAVTGDCSAKRHRVDFEFVNEGAPLTRR